MKGFVFTAALVTLLTLDISVGKENLALNQKTAQSSYLITGLHNYYGHYAVDGNNGTQLSESGCFHADMGDPSPWWTVDLGTSYVVHSLRIFNRGDMVCTPVPRCQDELVGFKVYVSVSANQRSDLEQCYHSNATSLPIVIDLNCSTHLEGRYVTITLESTSWDNNKPLTLCEVEVYGPEMPTTTEAPIPLTTENFGDSSLTTQVDNHLYQDTGNSPVEMPSTTLSTNSTIKPGPLSTITEPTGSSNMTDTTEAFTTTVARPETFEITASGNWSDDKSIVSTISMVKSGPLSTTTEPTSSSSMTNDITPSSSLSITNTPSALSTVIRNTVGYLPMSTDTAEAFAATNETLELPEITTSGNWSENIFPGCRCPPRQPIDVDPELYMSLILSGLEIDKTEWSSYRRKYESVVEDRPSAKYIGLSGLLIICLILGGLFLFDIGALLRDFRGVIQLTDLNSNSEC